MLRLYLTQINNSFGGQAFLPYSAGMLWSYAHSQADIADSYQLCDLLFLRETLSTAFNRIVNPAVLAVVAQLNTLDARRVGLKMALEKRR